MSVVFNINWSIYVRCGGKHKFLKTHLPAIESRIGKPELGWESYEDSYNPGQIRAFTFTNHTAESRDEAVLFALKQANKLYAGFWNVSGISTLNRDGPLYLYALMSTDKIAPTAPALTTVQIEVEEGRMRAPNADGGWYREEG